MLKKIITMSLILSVSLFAGGSHLTLGTSAIENNGKYSASIDIGRDIMYQLDIRNLKWLEMGLSLNLVNTYINNDSLEYSVYGTGIYKVGIDFDKLSYRYRQPLTLSVGAGYGYGYMTSDTYYNGPVYKVSLEWQIKDSFGVGYSYAYNNFDKNMEFNVNSIYVMLSFD